MNESLKELHGLLLSQFDVLVKKIDGTTDPAMAQAIVTEMKEILHRVDLVQNLLLRETTESLKTAVEEVKNADKELSKELKKIKEIKNLVDSVTAFLVCVDRAIDLAKAL
jgi:hypothetical protein